MSRHRLIVGVDYGTTYSGVSYVTTDKTSLEDINAIRSWPGKDGEWKTPTRIAYAFENTKHQLKDDLWGFQVDPQMTSCSWTKLLLDSVSETAQYDDPNLRHAIDEGRLRVPPEFNAQRVAADFLAELYKHLQQTLVKQIGRATFDTTPIDCWLTVPAVWSDQAQNATKDAAVRAGFGARPGDTISLIPEPEAAAVAILKDISQPEAMNKPRKGENILVCDCGGGTVDITSYSIVQIDPNPIFEEICVGIGAKCGATSLDRSLQELMSQRFGHSWDQLDARRKGPGSVFMNRWEHVKRQFGSPGDDRVQGIGPVVMKDVYHSTYYDEDEALVMISKEDIKNIFDPTIEEVIRLVQKQKDAIAKEGKRLNRLVLVGGFGESMYLYTRLREWCQLNGNIQPFCPQYAQVAVVRGAALRGLIGFAPRKKRCRRHYGFRISAPFRKGIDPESEAYHDHFSHEKMCRNRMLWMIEKGAEITEETFRSHSVSLTQRVKDPDRTLSRNLYSSAADAAPERFGDPTLEYVGTIHINYGNVDLSELRTKREHGVWGSKYSSIPFEVQVHFGSKNGLLTVRALSGGTLTGNADIVYE